MTVSSTGGFGETKTYLLIDGVRPFGNRRMLPLGPLREPIAAMNRADIIVITKTDSPVRNAGVRQYAGSD